MLKFFRKKNMTRIVLWGLLILILPPFVMWGTGNLGRSGEKGPTYVGIIDGKKISFEEMFESVTAMRSLLILNYFDKPQMLNTFLSEKTLIIKLAWDRLIILKEATKFGIKIPDSDVVAYIRSHPLFVRNGKFDEQIYEYALRYNFAMAARTFEEIIRGNLAVRQRDEMLTGGMTVSDEKALSEYKKTCEKLKILSVLFETKNFLGKTAVDDKMLNDYYENNKNEFRLPSDNDAKPGVERFANFDDVKGGIRLHLAEGQAKSLAYKAAQDAYKELVSVMKEKNKTFEKAAIELGLIAMESPFLSKTDYIEGVGEADRIIDMAANLKPDEISEPIRTRGGAIIFKVVDREGFDENRFKKEKEEFSKKLLEKLKADVLDKWFRSLVFNTKLNINLKDFDKYYR